VAYQYAGPADLINLTPSPAAVTVRDATDLAAFDLDEPFTFVVDLDGRLRLAPRRSEHVTLAAGGRVLAAGEVSFTRSVGGWRAVEVTNQSTGYCPDPDSWPAVGAALDRLGIRHPGDFTEKVVFRRCPSCGERNIVRDDDFWCALCDARLPPRWNFA
jgi:hypothetical protein